MKRPFVVLTALVLTAASVAAPATPKEQPQLLEVSPAAAPVPALKYQLLPELSEMNPGNAVPAYLKCFAEQVNFFFTKEAADHRQKNLTCPLSDIAPGSLKGYGGHALRQADYAARLEYCDWNVLPQMREQGYAMLLPEIQQMRSLGVALAVKCRGQIVDKDLDGAMHTLKTLFALARHMGQHPTLISGLVGVAIGNFALDVVEDFIKQPSAPNLFWALTDMPTRLVDQRRSASGERMLSEASFGTLLDKTRVWSKDDITLALKKVAKIGYLALLRGDEREAAEQWLRNRLKDEEWLKAARKTLGDAGFPADKLAKYLPEQVVFHHIHRKIRNQHDESLKWINVPFWQAVPAFEELSKPAKEIEDKMSNSIFFGVPKIRSLHMRLEQRIAMLRVVEAIRMEADSNGGKLPTDLGQIHSPLPADPATGKPFVYKLNGKTAIVTGKSSPLLATKYSDSYEVRLRK